MNGNRDELILQQQGKIQKDVNESTPFISEKFPLGCLLAEYNGDPIFMAKIADLTGKYECIRRIRPDGNCFFRSFAYSYLEYLATNSRAYHDFKILAGGLKDKLLQLGFSRLTLEDFHATFMDVIKLVNPDNLGGTLQAKRELHSVLNDQGYSDYVVVYLRLITSGKLQEQAEFYQHFIEGNLSIVEFCQREVEPMFKESDHIHIIALCSALGVGVRVEYVDRVENTAVKSHDFPEGSQPIIYLIYRPGHYDILYPN